MYRVIAELEERDGCAIFDPHAITIEDGGMKVIDVAQIQFKKRADPYGLLNPGKTRGWTAEMVDVRLIRRRPNGYNAASENTFAQWGHATTQATSSSPR